MDRQSKDGNSPSRRDFLLEMTALAMLGNNGVKARVVPSAITQLSSASGGGKKEKFVAIQIGARSFVDEGVEGVLDTLQEKGGVNVLMPAVFTYGRGLAGRQIPGLPLPDHGVQQYDEIYGGSYTELHEKFEAKSVIKNVRAPELGKFDILADVIPKAKARGMRTYCLFEEAYNPRLMPGFEKIAEVYMDGRIGGSTCLNNPHARDFLAALVEDWFTHNDLDGMMWESERQGPLNSMIGAHFGRFSGDSSSYCFCRYCVSKATALGINVDRVREGFASLSRWVKCARDGSGATEKNSETGAFVMFWRLLLEYPELITWQRFWFRSQEEVYALLYHTVKGINPKAQVGWHIMHLVTMSPFYQAEQDYLRLAKAADFLKPCAYNNCAGPRFAQYIENVQSTIFHDSTPEEVLSLHYRLLGYENEPSLDRLPRTGMSGQYVARETRRALAEVNGTIPIYTGIDIDIPTALDEKRTQPADVKGAVSAALQAGAPGVVLSRKYAEMRLTNLAGAGEALRELA